MVFQINKFDSCLVTGFTDIDISFDIGRGFFSEKRSFVSEQDANNYIRGCAKDALVLRLEKFINKVRNLANYDNGYYHTIAKDEALEWWRSTLPKLVKRDLPEVSKNILHFKAKLYRILPGEKHPYYKSLHNDALEIAAFARSNQEFKLTNLQLPTVAA